MGLDRFIRWKRDRPEWGDPTLEKIAQVAQDFLGLRWTVKITDPTWIVCETDEPQTFALRSCRDDKDSPDKTETFGEAMHREMGAQTRGFEVFFLVEKGRINRTSVITRQADEFTGALADRFAQILARWWDGEVESG